MGLDQNKVLNGSGPKKYRGNIHDELVKKNTLQVLWNLQISTINQFGSSPVGSCLMSQAGKRRVLLCTCRGPRPFAWAKLGPHFGIPFKRESAAGLKKGLHV